MDKKLIELKQIDSMQKITNISLIQNENQTKQQLFIKQLESLSPEDGLKLLDSLKSNNHIVFCYKAQIYLKINNYHEAYQMCQKAFQFHQCCVNEILQIKKLPFIEFLIQYFQKIQEKDNQLYHDLLQIKKVYDADQYFSNLFTDLQKSGAVFTKVSMIAENENNRKVVARNYIQKDQTILYIPKQKLILLQHAKQSQIVKQIHSQKLYLRSPKHTQLTIFLLEQEQLKQQSPYQFYLKHLPKNFDNFPINFKPQELQHLKGSPFLEHVQQKNIDMQRDYDAILSVYPDFSRFSYKSFRRFRLLVSSRIFGITIGKNRTDVLAPLADMLNHNIPKQTSWFYSDQSQGFVIKSVRSIEKGQQIYDSYGQKCNSRFLLNYGFTILQNDANQVPIKVSFQCQQQDQKTDFYTEVTLRLSKNIESKQFCELLSILRYSVMHQPPNRKQSLDLIRQTPFMGADIQAQIWQKLQKTLQGQIAAYPTTLKQDKKLLLNKQISTNYYNCIILRKGEKQILHFYLTMAKKMIKYFRSGLVIKGLQQLQQYQSYLKKLNFS